MAGYSVASIARNVDLRYQLEYLILLVDNKDNCVPFVSKSYKLRRIARSAMAGKVIAFSDMTDVAVRLAKEMEVLFHHSLQLQLLTDPKYLFDVICKKVAPVSGSLC